MFRFLCQILFWIFPWFIRRRCLTWAYGYHIDSTAHIGFSIILAKKLWMEANSSIGHLCICKKIDRLELHESASMGNFNKITGFPTNDSSVIHFHHVKDRKCELIIGKHTGITSNHYFDCNGGIRIGAFCQIAGFDTAFMTHSIDLNRSIQDAGPIEIGDYCFIGARCILLKGVKIADKTAISAMSLVNKSLTTSNALYGGVPCKFLKDLGEAKFFSREIGFV